MPNQTFSIVYTSVLYVSCKLATFNYLCCQSTQLSTSNCYNFYIFSVMLELKTKTKTYKFKNGFEIQNCLSLSLSLGTKNWTLYAMIMGCIPIKDICNQIPPCPLPASCRKIINLCLVRLPPPCRG